MRVALSVAIFVSLIAAGHAQDNPACAKFTNDFEYNACLARQGPKAGATRAEAEPSQQPPSGPARIYAPRRGAHFVASPYHGRRGRMQAVFSVQPRK